MEIILLQKISKLGNIGDTVQVKQGFGRNFLIPSGKALRATKENKEFFQKTKEKLLEENKEAIEKAEKIRAEVENLKLVIVRSASDTGLLYGSVTTRDISNLINEQGITLNKKQIALERPIKDLGVYDMRIILHPEVDSKIELKVVRSLGDEAFENKDDSNLSNVSDEGSTELNESLLEEGVSLKRGETNSEKPEQEMPGEGLAPEQTGTE
tara:strand:+ start:816 stop:1448 length:633 start_codon:yes stop_codon:yes gene_type:complete